MEKIIAIFALYISYRSLEISEETLALRKDAIANESSLVPSILDINDNNL